MNRTKHNARWLPAVALALAACEPSNAGPANAYAVIGPIALDSALAYVDQSSELAFLLDPASPDLAPAMVELGKHPVLAAKRTGSDELLVVTRGQRDEAGMTPEPARLYAIAPGAAKPRSWDLSSSFDRLAQSTDGNYAVLFFSKNTGQNAAAVLSNPNEIAVIDLSSDSAPVTTTVRSFGGVPDSIHFSPPFKLYQGDAKPRTLAVIRSEKYVTVLDLTHPGRSEATLPLSHTPTQVVFDVDSIDTAEHHPTAIYLLADGCNDLIAVRIDAREDGAGPPAYNDFRLSISLLAAGTGPADMALFESSRGPRLLVVAPQSQELLVIDPATSHTSSLKLANGANANRIVMFRGVSPSEPRVATRALLVAVPPLNQPAVTFVDVESIEERLARALDTRAMIATAQLARAFPAQGLVVIEHRNGPNTQLSIVDLAGREVSPITTEGFGEAVFVPDDASRLSSSDRLWIGSQMSLHLGYLTLSPLSALQAAEVRLDHQVERVFPMPRSRDGVRRLVADHGSPGGHLTILDAENPARGSARSVRGFLLTDYLERGAQ